MANGGLRIGIGFDVDKSGLNQVKTSLQEIQKQAAQAGKTGNLTKELKESSVAAQQLEQILDRAWNSKLQQFNLDKVNREITKTYGGVNQLKSSLEKSGPAGAAAYNQVASSLLNTNLQLRQSNKLLDNMAVSMANTVKWGITSSIFNTMTSSIQKAWSYTKNLDSSLNDIRIVTDESADSMEQFAISANKAAKELGASTLDYTNAALIYYQQGLSAEDVQARAEVTLKAANVTGQRGEEVSEQLTAVWNGYKVTAEEAELYIDKLAAVAATTASNLQELSVGMSKVASAANLMGVDADQLNAQLATIIAVTRQAPESVGTALKTIYARMGDIEAGLDSETTLGNYTEAMAEMGFNVLDMNGKLRDMGEVIEEIGEKWGTMSREQQLSLSQTIAGTRQYNNLLSLFDNWDMYTKALETSANAAGTLQKQQDTYMESTAAHLKQLKTESQRTYDIMFDPETVNGFIDVFSDALSLFNNFIEGIGGGGKALTYLGTIAAQVFNKQIAQGILKAKQSFDLFKANMRGESFVNDIIGAGVSQVNAQAGTGIQDNSAGYKAQLEAAKQIFEVRRGLTQEQYTESLEINKQIGLSAQKLDNLQKEKVLSADTIANLQIIKATESTDIDLVQRRVNYRQQENTELKDMRIGFTGMKLLEAEVLELKSKGLLTEEKKKAIEKELIQYKSAYVEYLDREGVETKDIEAGWIKISQQLTNGNLNASTFERILQKINAQENENNMAISAGLELIRAKSPELAKEMELEIKKLETLKQQNGELAKQGKTGVNTQKLVKGASAATGSIMALSGALTTFTDESATAEQKSHSLGSAFGGVAMAIFPAIAALGPWGMAIGAAVSLISNLIFSLDGVEKAFQSTEEKLKELEESQQEYISKTKEFADAKSNLTEVADEYEQLAAKAGQYDSTLENLTDEERKRYNELKDTILQYNSDALLGYNAEGEAILKKNQGIQETIDLLEKEYELKVRNQAIENWDTTKDIHEKQVKEAQNSVDYLKNKSESYTEEDLKIDNQYQLENISYAKTIFDENIQEIITEMENKISNGEASVKDLDNFINTIRTTDTAQTENVLEAARKIRDNIAFLEDPSEAIAAAELELQNAQKFNSETIANTIKYVEGYNTEWNKLQDLGFSNLDMMVSSYIESIQYDESKDITSYEDAARETKEYLNNLYSLLEGIEDPEAWTKDIQDFNILDFDTLDEYNQAAIDKMNGLIEANKEVFANMEEEQKQAILQALFGFEDIKFDGAKVASVESPYEDNEQAFYETKYSAAKNNITSLDSGIKALTSGDELDDAQIQSLEILSKKYEELGRIQNKNSHEYLAMLRTIREQEEDNARKALENEKRLAEEKANNLREKIDYNYEAYQQALKSGDARGAAQIQAQLELDITEFEETMNELQNADYSLKMQVDADLASDVEDAFGLAGELENLQELIGDDLTLTFEEAQNIIAQGYGEILQGAKETTEQTILLNKEKVNAYIDGKQAESEQDRQNKIEELENQKISLQTQKQILLKKLEALKKAKTAENAVDAAAALTEAKRQEALYQQEYEAMAEGLQDTSEKAQKTEDIDEALFTSLGGMYEQDSLNQQQAEVDATNTQKQEIENRLQNVYALHNAYTNLAKQIKEAPKGNEIPPDTSASLAGGGTTSITGSQDVQGTGDFGYEELSEATLAKFFDDSALNKTFQNTVDSLISATESSIDGIDNQLGAIDAGIAALKSAGTALDKYQKDLHAEGQGSDKDKMDLVKDQIDIYHDLDLELKNLSNSLSKLGKQEKKLFGQDLINNLNEQLGVLKAQTEVYQDKIDLAKEEASLYRSNLSSQGINFDSQGNVTNYVAAMKGKQDYLNSLISKYNSMSETEQKNFKSTVEQAKKDYEQFQKDMEYYEKLISDTIPGLEEQIQDALDKQIEIQIQKFTMEVEIRLEMAEAEREWNEFKKKIIDDIDDDDILGNALTKVLDFSSYYKDNGKGIVQSLTKQVEETLDQLNQIDATGTSSVYGDNKAQAMEDLQKYYTELMSQLEDVHDLVDEIGEAYLDMIDEANEKFDEQIEKYETVSDLIEHNMKVIELLNGDDAYDQLSKYYELQEHNNLKQLDFHRQEVAFWRERMESEEEGSEAWEAYRQNWQDAVSDLNATVEKSVEDLIAKYQNTVSGIFADLNDKITNGKGLNFVGEEWDLINKNADQYLDKINAMFEIQQLEGKYRDALDNTDTIAGQNKLNELMTEELSMLREKDKLTQYDIDRANLRYELALKEMALEDAKQSKSQMRLRRDAQGNYSYQFVADQDAISQAEQEVAAAQNDLYNLDKDKYQENLNEIYEVYVEFQEKLNELYMDSTLSDAEREEQKLLLVEQYGELINGLVEQNEDIRLNLQESALQAYADFQGTLLMDEIIPQWDSGVQEMADKFAGDGGFIPVCEEALLELDEATQDYEDSLEDLEDTAGISFDEIEDGIDKNIELTEDFIDVNDDLIDRYAEQVDALQEVQREVAELANKYAAAEKAAIAATEAAYKYWQQAKAMAADGLDTGVSSSRINLSGYNSNSSYGSTTSNGGTSTSTTTTPSKTPTTDPYPDIKISQTGQHFNGKTGETYPLYSSWKNGTLKDINITREEMQKKYPGKSFKTGGYTGQWTNGDNDGRLALLHQKELVLNSQDTENVLSAVNIVRSMSDILQSVKSSVSDRISGLMSRFSGGNAIANDHMTIEQNVHIDAKFEGQTESHQIQNALINLVNYASQHAYDTKR